MREGGIESGSLKGEKVLVVEDEALIAIYLESVLTDHGCDILGPYSRIGDVINVARDSDFDLALLNIYINGQFIYPVADILMSRNIPIVFLSGFSRSYVPLDRYGRSGFIQKPCHKTKIVKALFDAKSGAAA